MAKIDLSKLSLEEKLELEKMLAPSIQSDRAKQLEPLKKEIADGYKALLEKVKIVHQTESDFVPPWQTPRIDSRMKAYLIKHGEQTPADLAKALDEKESEVEAILKDRISGKRKLFVKNGDKYAAKQ